LWASNAFTDLDFESAALVPIPGDPYSRVYFGPALPGWSGFAGTNQLNAVLYDNTFLESAGVAVVDTNFPNNPGLVIQGDFTVLLQAGNLLGVDPLTPVNVSLSQTGLVPPTTRSLSFLAGSNGSFTVSLGGTDLNLISFPVANENYDLYVADVSAFAGQTAELTFTVLAHNPSVHSINLYLDDIQFSSDPIPEPSGLTLLLVGIVGLVFSHRTRPKTA
jgi:hypothetical protein